MQLLEFPIRTYKVVPVTPSDAVLEWVQNTFTFGHWVHGGNTMTGGAHAKYFPDDMLHYVMRMKLY